METITETTGYIYSGTCRTCGARKTGTYGSYDEDFFSANCTTTDHLARECGGLIYMDRYENQAEIDEEVKLTERITSFSRWRS